MTRRLLGRLVLVLAVAGACQAELTGEQLAMCSAAQLLARSMAGTETALGTAADGRPQRAARQAADALADADEAARVLQEASEVAQGSELWQGLIDAYKHASDAAASLLPEFAELRGTGPARLGDARAALVELRTELPAYCFEALEAA